MSARRLSPFVKLCAPWRTSRRIAFHGTIAAVLQLTISNSAWLRCRDDCHRAGAARAMVAAARRTVRPAAAAAAAVSRPLRLSRDRTLTHGYEATREAAMAAFAKSWRRE